MLRSFKTTCNTSSKCTMHLAKSNRRTSIVNLIAKRNNIFSLKLYIKNNNSLTPTALYSRDDTSIANVLLLTLQLSSHVAL